MTEPVSNDQVLAEFPSAWIDLDTIGFFRGMLERKLLLSRCDACHQWFQEPWPSCPYCWSTSITPTEPSGRGEVYTLTVPPGSSEALAVITLVEQDDLRVSARVIDAPAVQVQVGAQVELGWQDRDGRPVPVFRLVDGQGAQR